MTVKIVGVSWAGWDKRGDRPGALTKRHATRDGKVTLCGREIFDDAMTDFYEDTWGVDCRLCKRSMVVGA